MMGAFGKLSRFIGLLLLTANSSLAIDSYSYDKIEQFLRSRFILKPDFGNIKQFTNIIKSRSVKILLATIKKSVDDRIYQLFPNYEPCPDLHLFSDFLDKWIQNIDVITDDIATWFAPPITTKDRQEIFAAFWYNFWIAILINKTPFDYEKLLQEKFKAAVDLKDLDHLMKNLEDSIKELNKDNDEEKNIREICEFAYDQIKCQRNIDNCWEDQFSTIWYRVILPDFWAHEAARFWECFCLPDSRIRGIELTPSTSSTVMTCFGSMDYIIDLRPFLKNHDKKELVMAYIQTLGSIHSATRMKSLESNKQDRPQNGPQLKQHYRGRSQSTCKKKEIQNQHDRRPSQSTMADKTANKKKSRKSMKFKLPFM